MCYDNSDMPVFAATAMWIWIKGKQPVLTRNMLIREKNSTTPPHSVWSGALIKQKKRTFLHFKFAAFQKLHCLWLMPYMGLADKGLHRARWLKWQTGWFRIFSAWKPIITWNMIYDIYMSYATARYNVSLSFSWNVLHMRHVFASWLNN